jgi:hypothetical protein
VFSKSSKSVAFGAGLFDKKVTQMNSKRRVKGKNRARDWMSLWPLILAGAVLAALLFFLS